MALDVNREPIVWAVQISVLEKLIRGVEFLKEELEEADGEKYGEGILAKLAPFDEFPDVKFDMRVDDKSQLKICVYSTQSRYITSVDGCIDFSCTDILYKPCSYVTEYGLFDYQNFAKCADRSIGVLKGKVMDYMMAISKLNDFVDEMDHIAKRLTHMKDNFGSVLGYYANSTLVLLPYIIGSNGKPVYSKFGEDID